MDFPLPVWYDLDLSGKFTLSLSADRKSILPFDTTYAACKRISNALAKTLFEALGSATVRANLPFFESVTKLEPTRAKPFSQALKQFLAGQK